VAARFWLLTLNGNADSAFKIYNQLAPRGKLSLNAIRQGCDCQFG